MKQTSYFKILRKFTMLAILIGGLAFVSYSDLSAPTSAARQPCCNTCPGYGEGNINDFCYNNNGSYDEPAFTGCKNMVMGCRRACDPECEYGSECGVFTDCDVLHGGQGPFFDCVNGHCVLWN